MSEVKNRVVWLCPECFQPSNASPRIPDEEDRPCDHGVSLMPFVAVPELDNRLDEEEVLALPDRLRGEEGETHGG